MKKVFSLIYDRLRTCCLLFSAFVVFLTMYAEIVAEQVSFIASYNLIILFLFSFALSFANLVFKIKKIGTQIRLLLHAVLMFISISLLFYFNGMTKSGSHMSPQTLVVILVFVALAYAIVDGVLLVVKLFTKTKGDDEYLPMFKGKDKE